MCEWNKVEDGLPSPDEDVLVLLDDTLYDVDHIMISGEGWCYNYNVTHWMRIPIIKEK